MSVTWTAVRVQLAARSYDVRIGARILGELGRWAEEHRLAGKCAVITDTNVARLYSDPVIAGLRASGCEPVLIEVPAGENSKSLTQMEAICERMIEAGLDRETLVVALGGGVVGDLAGFVAAIYYRGIPLVQLPTTIVAQVDSAVGGKTGVNARGGKNLIGAFHQPRLVLADVETLRTLPEREFNEGFAEVIKHGIIRDRALFDSLSRLDRENLEPLIARNVEIKAAIVSADEHERTGERALLNFGHTIGHAIEAAAGYGRYLHGEAISLGIVAAANLSMRHAGLPADERDMIVQRLRQFGLPTELPPEIETDEVVAALRADKKFARGEVRFVLCPNIGSAFVSKELTLDHLRAAVEEIRENALP